MRVENEVLQVDGVTRVKASRNADTVIVHYYPQCVTLATIVECMRRVGDAQSWTKSLTRPVSDIAEAKAGVQTLGDRGHQ